jgi:pimeloyl-ACP methyl ester carboxylesterase
MPKAIIHGVEIFYDVHGAGEALVLLHGLGASSQDWEHQVPEFSHHYRVITPDLRGFGRSAKPQGPYSIAQFSADMLALLDILGVKQCHLLGLSMGGAVAFQMALDQPRRFKTLIIVNSSPSFELNSWRRRLMAWTRILVPHVFGMRAWSHHVVKRLFPKPEQSELRARLVARSSSNDRDAYVAAVHALKGWTVERRLGEIRIPTLVISAEFDYTPVSEKQEYVARMRNAKLQVIKDSRHSSHWDQWETFNRVVLDFLREHEQPAQACREAGAPVKRL